MHFCQDEVVPPLAEVVLPPAGSIKSANDAMCILGRPSSDASHVRQTFFNQEIEAERVKADEVNGLHM
jgi:hypothetical protein